MTRRQIEGASVPDQALVASDGAATHLHPSGFDPSRGEGLHPQYGCCDGFGPLGMCAECTGVIHCDDGTFTDNWRGGDNKLSEGQAANRVRAFLMGRIEAAALAGAMHTSEPIRLANFVRDEMADWLPRSFDSERPVGAQA